MPRVNKAREAKSIFPTLSFPSHPQEVTSAPERDPHKEGVVKTCYDALFTPLHLCIDATCCNTRCLPSTHLSVHRLRGFGWAEVPFDASWALRWRGLETHTKKKRQPLSKTVCFCQLRDTAQRSSEKGEEGGREGERRGESPQPSHQVEH